LRKTEDQEMLWKALSNGTIQTVGTDHCPFSFDQKAFGRDDFRKIPNGAGGIEHRMPLLYSYGVAEKRITWSDYISITSSNAARIFGLEPAKGLIAEGAYADLVLWNPNKSAIISAKNHVSKADTEIFEGFRTTGAPEIVIKGGKIVVENGQLVENISPGKLLRRY
jgi:dihydropyrimidinase